MKVFWLTKFTEEKPLPLYRSLLEADNIDSINIEETLPFNYVIIKNPKSSNSMYILHGLYLKSNECDALKLFMDDNITFDSNSKKTNTLEIRHLYDNINVSNMIELSTIACMSNLLTNHYIMLIPGGSLIIKTNTPILKAELSMNYTTQEL